MLKHPRLKYCYCAELLDDDHVLLLSEKKNVLLSGRLYALVLSHIQENGMSTEDLIARLDGKVSAAEVIYALNSLHKEGYVTETIPSLPSELCAYWNNMGMDVTRLLKLLKEQPVSVESLTDKLSTEPFVQAFHISGIRIDSTGKLRVVIADDYGAQELHTINQACLTAQQPWMLIKPTGTEPWIGPLFIPNTTGCWHCLVQRLKNNRPLFTLYQNRRHTTDNPPLPVVLSPMSLHIAANRAAIEVVKWLYGRHNKELEGKIISLDTCSCATRSHVLVKRPQCQTCGEAAKSPSWEGQGVGKKRLGQHETPEPTPNPSQEGNLASVPEAHFKKPLSQNPLTLKKRNAVCLSRAGDYRDVSFEDTLNAYQHHVSPITGIVQTLEPYFPDDDSKESPIYNYTSGRNLALQSKNLFWLNQHIRSTNVGKGKTWAQAKAGALCEAIERYSCTYQEDEPHIISSLRDLGDEGIHPNACMNYSDTQYRQREQINRTCTKFYAMVPVPFDESRTIPWTAVYSLTEQSFKYLPSCFCYAQYPAEDEHHLFCYPDTNGNAAGNSIEEAILHGFLELVERDSVALWWYNQLRKPAVDILSFDDPYFERLLEYYSTLNRHVYVLDITADLQIPAFAAISARVDDTNPDIIFAFGAHVDAHIAVERALIELNQLLPIVNVPEAERAAGKYRTQDPPFLEWLKTATRENQPYLKPLEHVPKKKASDYPVLCQPNVYDSVMLCVETAKKHNLKTLVLDMTRPDVGLNVVKVVVPGLRHFWKRLAPGRLYDVPVKMGWLKAPRKEEELNPVGMFI